MTIKLSGDIVTDLRFPPVILLIGWDGDCLDINAHRIHVRKPLVERLLILNYV